MGRELFEPLVHYWPYAVAVVGLLIVVALARRRTEPQRDPDRLFSSAQRRLGHERANNRCEQSVAWLFRCRRPSQHGDHWYPWSKGGATSMTNYAALCARCNLKKSAHIPTLWATKRLERRRRRYFPRNEPVKVGQRYRLR